MRRILYCIAGMFLVLGTLRAGEIELLNNDKLKLSLDALIRMRYEIDARDFNRDTGQADYGTLRSMLGFKFTSPGNVTLRMKFKESRDLGTQYPNKPPTTQLQMQEAYMKLDRLFGGSSSLQAGRFELYYGRYRILGTGDWNNHGTRAYDGLRANFTGRYGGLDLVAVKLRDYNYTCLLYTSPSPRD